MSEVDDVVAAVRERLAVAGVKGIANEADAVGLNRETWRKIRRRDVDPQPDNLEKLVRYLGGPEPYATRDEGLLFAVEKMQGLLDELREMTTESPEAAAARRASRNRQLVEDARKAARRSDPPKTAEG